MGPVWNRSDLREVVVEAEREAERGEPVARAQERERPRQQQDEADAGGDERRAPQRAADEPAPRASGCASVSATASTSGSRIAGGHAAVVERDERARCAITARHQRRATVSGRYPPTRSRLETMNGASA